MGYPHTIRMLCLAAVLGSTASAAACPRTLSVAVAPLGKLMQPIDAQQLGGMAGELFVEMGRLSGARFQFSTMPRVRAFADLKHGRIDIVPLSTRSADRDLGGTLVPMGQVRPVLIVRKDKAAGIRTVNDLLYSDLSITMLRGHQYGPSFDALLALPVWRGRVDDAVDLLTLVRKLKAGRADATLGVPVLFQPALEAEQYTEQVTMVDINLPEPLDEGLYLSRQLPADCVRSLAAAGKSIRDRGLYRAMIDRYVAPEWRMGFAAGKPAR